MSSPASAQAAARLPSDGAYAELYCLSNFSFQRGASHPEELVERAHTLGYAALAITDECSVAGVVRAHLEARKCGLRLLPGASFTVPLGDASPGVSFTLIALPRDLSAWGDLCEFITNARRSAPKGQYHVCWPDPAWANLRGCEVILCLLDAMSLEASSVLCIRARGLFSTHLWLGVTQLLQTRDRVLLHKLSQLSRLTRVPLLAVGEVLMHVRSRKPLQDVVTAVRQGQPLADCGLALLPNAENHLRARERLLQLYPRELLANTLSLAARCTFSLDELRYHYPLEAVLPGLSPEQTLRQFTLEGAARRYPAGVPPDVQQQLAHELALISELHYEMYFLTVHDIVTFARSQGIFCQGRGSAANSAVCYCLGVTEVDPARSSLLFERFISRERHEPPDIDVDFEHQRREEVIQYIYTKYGRERAALTAVVSSYRPRSGLRDVGRALGIDEALITALAREHPGMYSRTVLSERLQAALDRLDPGFVTPPEQLLALWLDLSAQIQGFPRHLSQHPGGFVLTQGPLTRLVPVENAAMPDRSVVQWDKDDLDAMGLLKVDVLALGMLSAIRRCLELVSNRRGQEFQMQDIPAHDDATFDMICRADTVGVFQIESRAQMSMLPRLKPRCFYDLVVEVAIVRPGPIQGGMVHPYLKARAHPDQVVYPSKALEAALVRTLGIPIFQEQVMQIAMIAADFTPGEADDLRRSMAAWKRKGGVHKFHDRLVKQMLHNGYDETFAENIFKQIEGFGEYGFPESHAASFALLVWASCWLKQHEPACFLAALLNSQPMGFYGPSQLVQDAQRHGVTVLPVDVLHSHWACVLAPSGAAESLPGPRQQPAVRLGLRLVTGLSQQAATRITQARHSQLFTSTEDLALRAGLDTTELSALASADALASLSGHRRQQVWQASALQSAPELLRNAPIHEGPLLLPAASEGEEVRFDYAAVGLTLRSHPLSLLRQKLSNLKLLTASQLRALPHGRLVRACGLVTMRQSPGTAHGVTFVTLEDETGTVNVIVWKALKERQRSELLHARLLVVHGTWQRDVDSGGQVCHVVAGHLRDLTPMLGELPTSSRDFH
ncbi:error-prone DNA polymerase [Rhodoferax sp. U11-2br]|uniref:error-prone DNA polymerase n=1 Tax=Rhodoferax sp. U11-2br TaxID=2838878 RepID=UPI001BE9CCA1|nr:error-prone DNA polymerase [Rhodoferax sp. U11-2br]MBT3068673.1 error-prone DNA polymerase [Rhodoferax sp. U11-2br]